MRVNTEDEKCVCVCVCVCAHVCLLCGYLCVCFSINTALAAALVIAPELSIQEAAAPIPPLYGSHSLIRDATHTKTCAHRHTHSHTHTHTHTHIFPLLTIPLGYTCCKWNGNDMEHFQGPQFTIYCLQ